MTSTIRLPYDRWPQYNRRLRDVIAAMSPDQLAIRPAPDLWPIWATVGHTAGSRVYWLCEVVYGLTTSAGMIGLIVSMVGGVLAAVVAMLVGVAGGASIWIGLVGGVAVLVALIAYGYVTVESVQSSVPARFPTPGTPEVRPDPE